MQVKYFKCPFELKAVDEKEGKFSGYGAAFGNVDWYRDIIEKGAFSDWISQNKGSELPLLWQHSGDQPIGIIPVDSMYEDDFGLFISPELVMEVSKAKDAYHLMKRKAIKGLSIGWTSPSSTFDQETGITKLHKINLWEISIVTFPANELARVTDVKKIFEDGGMPSEREIEGLLKEAGFSRSQAKSFISKGYRGIQRDAENCDELNEKAVEVLAKLNEILKGDTNHAS